MRKRFKHEARGSARRALVEGTSYGLSNGPSSSSALLWGPWKVMTGPQAQAEAAKRTGYKTLHDWVHRVFVNKRYLVMTANRDGGVLQILVQRTDGRSKRNWHDLQRIKDEIAGHSRTAIEVFPPADEVIDGAHVTHLWVLPEGFELPVQKEWV